MDGGDFGTFGVLRFMRRHEETVIASYPIDNDEVTFGCDPSCGVRLYYPTVSPLHAKIIFQERKAFIEVLGVHGLLVDKCPVFPASTTTHTTVPLTNNSELEISKKRFRFEYPPKALRPVLAFTPPPQSSNSARKRVLRLSMIQSAQVFTPRPDPDPHVNLRVLQTPIRLNPSPLKQVHRTPGQAQVGQQVEEFGTPIRLVEGNRPRVVEEEQDLVILEEVDLPEHVPQANTLGIESSGGSGPSAFVNPMQGPTHAPQMSGPAAAFPLPPSHQFQQFQTPRRRPGRPSLHRAVLIRSAQRAVMRVEMEKEQEQEEREVEEHVLPIEEQMEMDEDDQGDQNAVTEEFDEEVEEDDDTIDPGPDPGPTTPVFGWQKGFEAFKSGFQALRPRSRSPEKNEHAERDVVEARISGDDQDPHGSLHDDDDQLDQDGKPQELEVEEDLGDISPGYEGGLGSEFGTRAASVPRQFTPQRPQRSLGLSFMTPQVTKVNGGLSLADRVRGRKSTGNVGRPSLAGSWQINEVAVPEGSKDTPTRISESERQAIQERRRSALAQPDMFFGGNIPGSRRTSLGSDTPGAKAAVTFVSPSKAWATIKEDEEEAETTTLLEKMKEVVEGMQRRRSMQVDAPPNVPISNKSEEDDAGEQAETYEVREATAEERVPLQADFRSAARSFPATPNMSDFKHVFSEKRAVNVPPSYAGVRTLFKEEHAPNPETPRLDGVREMFFRARAREPKTPIFEGVGEMLATPPRYSAQGAAQSIEVEMESTAEARASVPSDELPREKSSDPDHAAKPGFRTAAKAPEVRSMRDGRATPTEVAQLADDELASDVPPAKSMKPSSKASKGSTVKRTSRRGEANEDIASAPTKLASKAKKIVAPEVAERIPTEPNPAEPVPGSTRRSRAATSQPGPRRRRVSPPKRASRHVKRSEVKRPDRHPQPAQNRMRNQNQKQQQSPQRAHAGERGSAANRWKWWYLRLLRPRLSDALAPSPRSMMRPPPPRTDHRLAPPIAQNLQRRLAQQPARRAGRPSVLRRRRTKARARARCAPPGASGLPPALQPAPYRIAWPLPARTRSGRACVVREEQHRADGRGEGEHAGADPREGRGGRKLPPPLPQPQVAGKGSRARKGATVPKKAESEPEKGTTAPKTRAPRTRATSGRK
ncbi:hypothetical protein BC826DRAFT_558631 [Russula brevipes]|nr:hypothetical protein BC826DRAFT_558631 [Russula brevipes]